MFAPSFFYLLKAHSVIMENECPARSAERALEIVITHFLLQVDPWHQEIGL